MAQQQVHGPHGYGTRKQAEFVSVAEHNGEVTIGHWTPSGRLQMQFIPPLDVPVAENHPIAKALNWAPHTDRLSGSATLGALVKQRQRLGAK
jgi:hypothetical protein